MLWLVHLQIRLYGMSYSTGHASPLFVGPLAVDERTALETGLRSVAGFTVRRCWMLLVSTAGQPITALAHTLRHLSAPFSSVPIPP